jgi:hypothetical protein
MELIRNVAFFEVMVVDNDNDDDDNNNDVVRFYVHFRVRRRRPKRSRDEVTRNTLGPPL